MTRAVPANASSSDESETRFREIADAAPVMIWISDTTKACTWFNRPWLEFTGHRLDEEIGDGWVVDIHPDDLAACVATYHSAFDRRERFHSDYRLRRHDGAWRVVEDTGVPRFSRSGTFLGYVGSCVDVTDQRTAEQALRHSEEQLRLATDAAEIGLWDVDPVSQTLFWPPRVKAMFGISPDVPVTMRDFYAGLHPDDRDAVSLAFASALDPTERAVYDVEYRAVGKADGVVRWVAAKGRGIFDATGQCVRVIGTAIDITARKEAESRLREREEHLRAVVDTSPECVKLVARDGTLLQMNASGLAMVGARDERAVVGTDVYAIIAPEHRDAYRAFNERVCDGSREQLEFDIVGLNGKRRHMESHAVPLAMPDGRVVQLALTRDVTARREAEEALRESDRRKDEFIATLSHELRNPLAPLKNALHVARMGDARDSQLAAMHAMMERQLDHLVRLVDDLLEVSRITHGALELRRERVELATIVRNAVETSRPAIDAAMHELVVKLPATPVWLEGDPTRLAQILSNLLNNAARYMPLRGRIALSAAIDGDAVAIAVRDQGAGFDAASASRMFRMFGRGKASNGLGIGLALARGLAEMHGGTIDAASDGPGKGAVFTLRLPIAAPPEPGPPRVAEPQGSIRGQRVLVVDDNRDAADSLRLMLELLGADVRVARSGREALARFAEWGADAVLLDIGMPEMDGYEVARAIRQRPDGKRTMIVAVTGWGQESDRQRSSEAGFDHHLVKPADLHAIEALLASLPARVGDDTAVASD
jgi:PAS domain S-box-containing protein